MLVAAVALLVLAFLVVLAPLIFATAVRYVPWLEPLWAMFNFLRLATAAIVFDRRAVHRAQVAAGRPAAAVADLPGIA